MAGSSPTATTASSPPPRSERGNLFAPIHGSMLRVFLFVALSSLPLSASTLHIEVVLSEKRLTVYQDGAAMRSYPIAIGTIDYPTPEGEYEVHELIWNPKWVPLPNREWTKNETPKEPTDPENPMRVLKIPFDPPYYYIHGTPDDASIGTMASHGCLRLSQRDAADLGRFLIAFAADPRNDAWIDETLRAKETRVVKLAAPIPLRIRMGDRNVYPGVIWAVE